MQKKSLVILLSLGILAACSSNSSGGGNTAGPGGGNPAPGTQGNDRACINAQKDYCVEATDAAVTAQEVEDFCTQNQLQKTPNCPGQGRVAGCSIQNKVVHLLYVNDQNRIAELRQFCQQNRGQDF